MPPITLPTLITAADVETAVMDTIKARLPYYMEQLGLSTPKSYIHATEVDKLPEDQLPTVVVVCSGLSEQPMRLGDGTHIGKWLVGLACICSARQEVESRDIARRTGALMRAILLQQASLTPKGFARGVTWMDETYDQVDTRDRRTLSSAEVVFSVEVAGVVDASELPFMPDMDEMPSPTGYEATEAITDVQPFGGN